MPEAKIIEEREISLSELSENLKALKKGGKELGVRATKVEEYINYFGVKPGKEVDKIIKAFDAAQIPRLKERHIAKLIDLSPQDVDSVKVILSGENLTFKAEDLKRIVEILND